MSPAGRARDLLAAWPHLTRANASCGLGDALVAEGSEIVHLHVGTGIDVHLTPSVIGRFAPELQSTSNVRLLDGSAWITVHVESDEDADQLMTWVSVALQTYTALWPVPPPTPCTVQDTPILRLRPSGRASA